MNRRDTVLAITALIAGGVPSGSLAQQKDRTWRVGYFSAGSEASANTYQKAFLAGMKERGYEVGRNLIVDRRHAEGDSARYAMIADELLSLKPDVLLVSSTGNAIVTKSRTTTIPIVLGSVGDPVGDGLVQGLARPGGNVTGNSLQLFELGAKQVDLMIEALPGLRRVAVLTNVTQAKSARDRYEQIAGEAAAAKGLSLRMHRVEGVGTTRKAFRDLQANQVDALLINPSPALNVLRKEICQNALTIRLPLVGFSEEWAQDGALLSFGPSWAAAYHRAAYFVDRIFKGAKPADLPLEQPTKFNMVVNQRTAKALGIRIPQSMLVRADRAIE